MIAVALTGEKPSAFTVRVTVDEGSSRTTHDVTLARADLARLGRPGEPPDAFVERCFAFLLAREPKESILRQFDVTVIGQYFPEFEREIRKP